MPESKLQCTVNEKNDGVAHIIEQEYNNDFKVWYGAVDISVPEDEWYKLMGKDVKLRLNDGRLGVARVLSGHGESVAVAHDDQVPGQTYILYVIGISALKVPGT